MSDTTRVVTLGRLQELRDKEVKLEALEAGGVDNWEGYGESLKEYFKKKEIKDRVNDLADTILEVLSESAYEPSEHGAGLAFHDEAKEEVGGHCFRD